jgi:hypothetical protein
MIKSLPNPLKAYDDNITKLCAAKNIINLMNTYQKRFISILLMTARSENDFRFYEFEYSIDLLLALFENEFTIDQIIDYLKLTDHSIGLRWPMIKEVEIKNDLVKIKISPEIIDNFIYPVRF